MVGLLIVRDGHDRNFRDGASDRSKRARTGCKRAEVRPDAAESSGAHLQTSL